ncbi:unnamed protein product [Adineta steineri]|uniref:Uncharacterized protein n=1 Tax=Adineta steineri TaxID=433720 RepID=A0A815Q2N8_9BILA|nr:unnamed protein product [Adineta steineri]CAF3844421.1 unnamed protein product [Adineta steineri]
MLINISIAIEPVSMSSMPTKIKLSDIEVRYLTERLKKHEHMCDYDAKNTITELEHYYTVLKNKDGAYEPSAMVDRAWHHHILHTKMYNMFSRQHFGMELLHHVPFWSGNEKENVGKSSNGKKEFDFIDTYETVVSIFGSQNVNETVWYMIEDDYM